MKQNFKNKSLRLAAILWMFLILMSADKNTFGQLRGSINVPSLNYPSIKNAIDSLNLYGVGSGGVTVNVASAYSETAPTGRFKLTATGWLI
jgi:hypothetical protein